MLDSVNIILTLSELNLPSPPRKSTKITAVTDSGAQTFLIGLSILRRLGLKREHLACVSKPILAANDEVNVLGAVFLIISGHDERDQCFETSAMVYVTNYLTLLRQQNHSGATQSAERRLPTHRCDCGGLCDSER